MKKLIIGIATAICITLGFSICGSGNTPSSPSMPGTAVEKIFASDSAPETPVLQKGAARDATIFSWSTILILSMGVIGVVAFRRNSYI